MTNQKPRRIVAMTQLPEHGYGFSVKTCYEWCGQAIDPMPFIDMSKPGAKNKRYFIDLDELDAWIERRAKHAEQSTTAPPIPTKPSRRQPRQSRREECDALGIETEHAFA